MRMCIVLLFLISCITVCATDIDEKVYVLSIDHRELIPRGKLVSSYEFPIDNSECNTITEFDDWLDSLVKLTNGNVVYYKRFRWPSMVDPCVRAKIDIFIRDPDSSAVRKVSLVDISSRLKYAIKISGGVNDGSYYGGVGYEYVLPYLGKIPLEMFLMPEIFFFNTKNNQFDIQIAGPTLSGIVDFFAIANLNGLRKEKIRYGAKIDGGFIITEMLTKLIPSDYLKYGRNMNYRTTIQPYVSYIRQRKEYGAEWKFGIVYTRWLNEAGLIICCK